MDVADCVCSISELQRHQQVNHFFVLRIFFLMRLINMPPLPPFVLLVPFLLGDYTHLRAKQIAEHLSHDH